MTCNCYGGYTGRRRKPQSVTVVGRRWFDRANGNTYFSARMWVDGIELVNDVSDVHHKRDL